MNATVTIRDGMGHMNEAVEIRDGSFVGTDWVVETLTANGCEIGDEMDAGDIADAVRGAWISGGYEGDPDENGLTVQAVIDA